MIGAGVINDFCGLGGMTTGIDALGAEDAAMTLL
jgi:hypothetical protein